MRGMGILKMARIKNEEIGVDVKPGRPKIDKKPRKAELQRLYAKELKSIRETACQLCLHPDTIHYWLKKYGIKTRSMAKRSKLRKHNRSTLEKGTHYISGYRGQKSMQIGLNLWKGTIV